MSRGGCWTDVWGAMIEVRIVVSWQREGREVQRGVDVKSRACNPSLSASRLPTSIDTEKDGIGLALEHVRVSLVKSVV